MSLRRWGSPALVQRYSFPILLFVLWTLAYLTWFILVRPTLGDLFFDVLGQIDLRSNNGVFPRALILILPQQFSVTHLHLDAERENVYSSLAGWDSNPQPLGWESSDKTTIPWHLPRSSPFNFTALQNNSLNRLRSIWKEPKEEGIKIKHKKQMEKKKKKSTNRLDNECWRPTDLFYCNDVEFSLYLPHTEETIRISRLKMNWNNPQRDVPWKEINTKVETCLKGLIHPV